MEGIVISTQSASLLLVVQMGLLIELFDRNTTFNTSFLFFSLSGFILKLSKKLLFFLYKRRLSLWSNQPLGLRSQIFERQCLMLLLFYRRILEPNEFLCFEEDMNWVEFQVLAIFKQHQKNCSKVSCFCQTPEEKPKKPAKTHQFRKRTIEILNDLVISRLNENFEMFTQTNKVFWGLELAKYRLFFTKNILSLIHFLANLTSQESSAETIRFGESYLKTSSGAFAKKLGDDGQISENYGFPISYSNLVSLEAFKREATQACRVKLECFNRINLQKVILFTTAPIKSSIQVQDSSVLSFDKFLDFEDFLDKMLKEISLFLSVKNKIIAECLNEPGSRSIRHLFKLFEKIQNHHESILAFFTLATKKLSGHPSPFLIFGAFLSLAMFEIQNGKKTFVKASKGFVPKISRVLNDNILFLEGRTDSKLVFIEVSFDPNYDLKVQRVSPLFSQIFKKSSGEIQNQPIETLMPKLIMETHKNAIQSFFHFGFEKQNSEIITTLGRDNEGFIFPVLKLTKLAINTMNQLCFYTLISPIEKFSNKPICVMDKMGKIVDFSRKFPGTLRLNSYFMKQSPLNVSFLSPILSRIMAAYRRKLELINGHGSGSKPLSRMNSGSASNKETKKMEHDGFSSFLKSRQINAPQTYNNISIVMDGEAFDKTPKPNGNQHMTINNFDDEEDLEGLETVIQMFSGSGGAEMTLKVPKSLVTKSQIAKRKSEKLIEKMASLDEKKETKTSLAVMSAKEKARPSIDFSRVLPDDQELENLPTGNFQGRRFSKNVMDKFGMIKIKIMLKRHLEKARRNIKRALFYEIKAMVQLYFYTSSCGSIQMPCLIIHEVISSKLGQRNSTRELGTLKNGEDKLTIKMSSNLMTYNGSDQTSINYVTIKSENLDQDAKSIDQSHHTNVEMTDLVDISKVSNQKNFFSFADMRFIKGIQKEDPSSDSVQEKNEEELEHSQANTPNFHSGSSRRNPRSKEIPCVNSQEGFESIFLSHSAQGKEEQMFSFSNNNIAPGKQTKTFSFIQKTKIKDKRKEFKSRTMKDTSLQSKSHGEKKKRNKCRTQPIDYPVSLSFKNENSEGKSKYNEFSKPPEYFLKSKTSLEFDVNKVEEDMGLLELVNKMSTPLSKANQPEQDKKSKSSSGNNTAEKHNFNSSPSPSSHSPKSDFFTFKKPIFLVNQIEEESFDSNSQSGSSSSNAPYDLHIEQNSDHIIEDREQSDINSPCDSRGSNWEKIIDQELSPPIKKNFEDSSEAKESPKRGLMRKNSLILSPMDYSFVSQLNMEGKMSQSADKLSSRREELLSNVESFANKELRRKLKKGAWFQAKIAEMKNLNPKFIRILLLLIKFFLLLMMASGFLFDFQSFTSVGKIQSMSRKTIPISRSLTHGCSIAMEVTSSELFAQKSYLNAYDIVLNNLEIVDGLSFLKYSLLRYHYLAFLGARNDILSANEKLIDTFLVDYLSTDLVEEELILFFESLPWVSEPLFSLVFAKITESASASYSEKEELLSTFAKVTILEKLSPESLQSSLERVSELHKEVLKRSKLRLTLFGSIALFIALFGLVFVSFRTFSLSSSHSKIIGFFYNMDTRAIKLTLNASQQFKAFLSNIVISVLNRDVEFLIDNELGFSNLSTEEFLKFQIDEKTQNKTNRLLKGKKKTMEIPKGILKFQEDKLRGPKSLGGRQNQEKRKGKSEQLPFVLLPFFLVLFCLFSFFISLLFIEWMIVWQIQGSAHQIVLLHDDFTGGFLGFSQDIFSRTKCFMNGECKMGEVPQAYSVNLNEIAFLNSEIYDQELSKKVKGYFEEGFLCREIGFLCTEDSSKASSVDDVSAEVSLCLSILYNKSQEEMEEVQEMQECIMKSLVEIAYVKFYLDILSSEAQAVLERM